MDYTELPFINKVTENREEFGNKVIAISNDLGFLPQWLMIVMNNESGLDSTIHNPFGSATGLIQFTEATANDLGTTTAELAAMSNVDQLDYVKKYFTKYGYYKKVNSVADCYAAIFYPAALYKDDNFIFPKWASDANKIFDINGDGVLTKGEFSKYVNDKYAAYIPQEQAATIKKKKQ